MTLANNHLNDFGDLPVNYTIDALKEVGIKTVGVTYGPYNSNQVKRVCNKTKQTNKQTNKQVFIMSYIT